MYQVSNTTMELGPRRSIAVINNGEHKKSLPEFIEPMVRNKPVTILMVS